MCLAKLAPFCTRNQPDQSHAPPPRTTPTHARRENAVYRPAKPHALHTPARYAPPTPRVRPFANITKMASTPDHPHPHPHAAPHAHADAHADAFALLGLPRRFDLTPAQVQQAYLAASVSAHPDRAGASTHEQAHAHARAAQLNAAKQALEDPERRANLLLNLIGGPAPEADRSLPAGFLLEMMALRDDVEAAKASGDHAAINHQIELATARRAAILTSVAALFRHAQTHLHLQTHSPAAADAPDAQSLKSIRTNLNALRYIERLIEQLDNADT